MLTCGLTVHVACINVGHMQVLKRKKTYVLYMTQERKNMHCASRSFKVSRFSSLLSHQDPNCNLAVRYWHRYGKIIMALSYSSKHRKWRCLKYPQNEHGGRCKRVKLEHRHLSVKVSIICEISFTIVSETMILWKYAHCDVRIFQGLKRKKVFCFF